jgi:hypothetical protein
MKNGGDGYGLISLLRRTHHQGVQGARHPVQNVVTPVKRQAAKRMAGTK